MLLQEIKNIDPTARRTIRSLAGAVGIPVMTIWRMKQSKKLKVHTMALKPKLNDDHRLNRLFHCIAKNDKNTINSVAEMTFKSMYNEIHMMKNGSSWTGFCIVTSHRLRQYQCESHH
ncbi:hypothetical protein IV203_025568 [Nitzschia inconspicua]|uniref:Uncharacterized protein n=1 Tax=Nitzschia inconspicua TaxID=303405 RepID=A0A9K3PW29_9STRA|nr:hypothetical protein IV203_025568 [Nitzschia inconspicua]